MPYALLVLRSSDLLNEGWMPYAIFKLMPHARRAPTNHENVYNFFMLGYF